jgi:hypothetical protein
VAVINPALARLRRWIALSTILPFQEHDMDDAVFAGDLRPYGVAANRATWTHWCSTWLSNI